MGAGRGGAGVLQAAREPADTESAKHLIRTPAQEAEWLMRARQATR
jgi:hypothetical protein